MTTPPTTASTTNTTEQRSCPLLVFQEELRETLTNPDTTTLTLVLSRQNNTSNLSALTNLLQQELSSQSHRIEHLVITTLSDEASDEPEWTTPAAQNLFIALGQLLPRLRSLHLEGLGSISCALEEDDVAIGFPLFLVMLLLVSIPLPKDDTAPRTLVESMTIQNCRFQVPPDPTLAQQCGRLLARVVTHRLTQLQTLVWDERISSVGSWTTVEEESNSNSGASIVMDLPCVTDAILQLPHLKYLQISGRYPYGCGSYDGLERNPMAMGTIHSGAALGPFSRKATSLFLQDVRLGPAALGALANALSDPKCSLQTLHIDLGMSTTPSKSSDNTEWAQQLLKFVTAFKTNTRLETLALGISYDQQLWRGSCKIVSQLAQALMGNRTLSTLRLFSNSSTNLPQQQQEGTIVAPERNLFNFFDPVLPNMCNGDPDNNDDDDGDVIIEEGATAITQQTHPNFPEEDAAAFVRLLEVNTTLKYARLDDYNILYDDEASQGRWAPLLEYYTDVNIRYDQRHEGMLSSSSPNNKWCQVVASAANHSNVTVAVEATFYWLRQYPSFASAACI